MKLKGYVIKDTNEKVVIIPNYGTYRVKTTGEVFENTGEIKVKDFGDLVKLNLKTRVKNIKHKETGDVLSESEYLEKEKELLSKRHYDSEEYTHNWKSLDDEFNYRKFIASYEKVNETFYEEEEVIVEEIKEVLLNTNHPFITSKFSAHGEISDICVYDKYNAYKAILKEKMEELGAEEVPDITFGINTDGKLAWSNSTHSCIRFVKFAGTYLFNESFDIKNPKIGTLDSLIKEYEEDREKIRKIIHDKYLLLFGKFDESKTPKVLTVINNIEGALNCLWSVSATKKTDDKLSKARDLLRKAKDTLNESFKL